LISIAVLVLRIAVISGVIVCGILLLVQNIRKGLVPWRATLRIAVPAAVLTGVGPALSLNLLMKGYNTAIPLDTFRAVSYMIVLMSVIFAFLTLGAAVALLLSAFPDCASIFRSGYRRALAADALYSLAAAIGLSMCVRKLGLLLLDRFHAQALYAIGSRDLIVVNAPGIAAVAGAVRSSLVYAALLATVALVLQRFRRPWVIVVVAIPSVVWFLPGVRTPAEFAVYYLLSAAMAAGI